MEKKLNKIEGYISQNSCKNCKHVFVKHDYEDSDQLYCTRNAGPRPKCGSCQMLENFHYDYSDGEDSFRGFNNTKTDSEEEAWEIWSDGRYVRENGICPNWETK